MNTQQQPFSVSMSDKRNTFAKEIRREKKSAIIGQKRKFLYQEHLRILAQLKGKNIDSISSADLIQKLQKGPNEEKLLHQLLLKLQSANENPRMIVEQIFNSAKYCYLIDNLNSGRFINETLSVFSVILARPDFQKTTFLVNKGLLEILIELFGKHIDLAGRIANIIGNICIDSDDYCDWILENNVHNLVIDVFGRLYEKFSTNQTNYNPQTELGMILWMLAIIVGTVESTLDFTSQYDDVLRFSVQLFGGRIMVKRVIIIVYELAIKYPERVKGMVTPVINELIKEETGSTNYFDQLLILTLKLTPADFDYETLFKVVLLGNYQKAKRALMIIEQLGESPVLDKVMNDEFWWQKTLIKLQTNSHETRFALSIIRKHKLNFPCVWRFVTDYLENQYSKDVISDILLFLKVSLMDASSSRDKGHYLLEGIKKSKIEKKLEKLLEKELLYLVDKIQEVLFLINQVAQDLKDKYEIDVEI